VLHDVPEEDRRCTCGRAKTKIGEDVTEQLEYIPGKIEVLRHIYPKYACSCCKDGVTVAVGSDGGRKPGNTADAPDMAGMCYGPQRRNLRTPRRDCGESAGPFPRRPSISWVKRVARDPRAVSPSA
jgi:hypothetical protein